MLVVVVARLAVPLLFAIVDSSAYPYCVFGLNEMMRGSMVASAAAEYARTQYRGLVGS